MAKTLLFLAMFFLSSPRCFAQLPLEKELLQKFAASADDAAKISALGELAEFYTIYRADKKADSVLEIQLSLAEVSNDKNLIKQALFGNALNTLSPWTGKETFDRAMAFVEKGLVYAKQAGISNLETVAYLRKASLLRKRKMYVEALLQASLASATLNTQSGDSLKTEIFLEQGNIFLAKMDIGSAYRNFNTAYEIAYAIKNTRLQSTTLHQLAELYKVLENEEEAKSSLLESVALNTKEKDSPGLMLDYVDLFKLSDQKEYLYRATNIADSIHSVRYQLFCKKLTFFYLAYHEKKSDAALAYLTKNQDLYQSFVYQGILNYYIGTVYQYSGQPAIAIKYYLLEEPLIVQSYESSVQTGFFLEIAQCYKELKQTYNAIAYFEKTFLMTKGDSASKINSDITYNLSQLYAGKKEYEKAYEYSQLNFEYRNKQNQLAEQRDVAGLSIEREKKKEAKDLEDKAAEELRQHNLQYTGISMAIAFLFVILLVTGMFPVSKVAIRMLNFFSFICLFEFIILLIDNWLHDLTHGEPLRIWIAKIFIIALLLPLHHTLEHWVVRFLASPKLIEFRRRISFKKFWRPSKKTVAQIEKNLEESTLV